MADRIFDADPDLHLRAEALRRENVEGEAAEPRPSIRATPFVWTNPADIPPREWLYGRHLIRAYISATIAPGGFGKSSLIVADALAMVTGRALLGDQPSGQLRVWQINLEDPEDELRRRVAAAALHFKIDPEEIGNRLFLDSGRKTKIVIATENRGDIKIAVPLVAEIKAQILDKALDVLTIDPFVACHAVSENDNTKIDKIARQWAAIAEETGCAIELVHHARKGGGAGQSYTVEDARGATALIAAVRSARVLNGMTKEEGERANVLNHTSYFSVTNGKANLAPRSEKATWRHFVSVGLGNGKSILDPGDFVGVVEPWAWPDAFAEVSLDDVKEVQRRIAKGDWRADPRAENWAGKIVAEVLGFDLQNSGSRASVRLMLASWRKTGALKVIERLDEGRHKREFFEVGKWLI